MCVISVLPKGTEKHTKQVENFIESGFWSNTQGSGFMWKRNGQNKIGISKGYFSLDALQKAYKDMKFNEDDEVVVHHRIGTSGNKDSFNTHPFYIHKDINTCVKTDGFEKLPALCHNGVFSYSKIGKYMTTGYSDTVAFANKVMTMPGLLELLKDNTETFKAVMDDIIDTDKVAYLFPDRDLIMIGSFIADNGYYHSNMGYKRYTHNVGGVEYPTSTYKSPYGNWQSYWEYEEEDYALPKDIVTSNKQKIINITKPSKKSNIITLQEIDDKYLRKFKNLDYESYCLDSSIVNITDYNYLNFWLTPKKDVRIANLYDHGDLFMFDSLETTKQGMSGPVLTTIKQKEGNKCFGYKLEFIEENFNYIPMKIVANVYKDYLYLYELFNIPSNKKLKSIHQKLNEYSDKQDLATVEILNFQAKKLAWIEFYNQHCHHLSDLYTMIPQDLIVFGDITDEYVDSILEKIDND